MLIVMHWRHFYSYPHSFWLSFLGLLFEVRSISFRFYFKISQVWNALHWNMYICFIIFEQIEYIVVRRRTHLTCMHWNHTINVSHVHMLQRRVVACCNVFCMYVHTTCIYLQHNTYSFRCQVFLCTITPEHFLPQGHCMVYIFHFILFQCSIMLHKWAWKYIIQIKKEKLHTCTSQ